MYIAAEKGHTDIAQLLVDQGADKDLAKNDGVTPLYIAAGKGHTDVAQLLVDQGADKGNAPHTGSNAGMTPLFMAAQMGHTDIVQLLVDQGADKNAVTRDHGQTAASIAAEQGSLEALRCPSIRRLTTPTSVVTLHFGEGREILWVNVRPASATGSSSSAQPQNLARIAGVRGGTTVTAMMRMARAVGKRRVTTMVMIFRPKRAAGIE